MERHEHRNLPFFKFEDLRIYHKAIDYLIWVQSKGNKPFAAGEAAVYNKFIEAAYQVITNIAEGSVRPKDDFLQFLRMSKSSVRECLVASHVMHRGGLFSDEELEESKSVLIEMVKMLGAMISSIHRFANEQEEEPVTANQPNHYDHKNY
ncbi:MAG: four helix bundle protein [Bacteroidales bacterium]|jgi:four helix bundle protein|nr:four helix bundle protein [Bacteroidales bacterium]